MWVGRIGIVELKCAGAIGSRRRDCGETVRHVQIVGRLDAVYCVRQAEAVQQHAMAGWHYRDNLQCGGQRGGQRPDVCAPAPGPDRECGRPATPADASPALPFRMKEPNGS
jgi:hypothetical protein